MLFKNDARPDTIVWNITTQCGHEEHYSKHQRLITSVWNNTLLIEWNNFVRNIKRPDTGVRNIIRRTELNKFVRNVNYTTQRKPNLSKRITDYGYETLTLETRSCILLFFLAETAFSNVI